MIVFRAKLARMSSSRKHKGVQPMQSVKAKQPSDDDIIVRLRLPPTVFAALAPLAANEGLRLPHWLRRRLVLEARELKSEGITAEK
jgi:hypothetical protein